MKKIIAVLTLALCLWGSNIAFNPSPIQDIENDQYNIGINSEPGGAW